MFEQVDSVIASAVEEIHQIVLEEKQKELADLAANVNTVHQLDLEAARGRIDAMAYEIDSDIRPLMVARLR